jgi:hypothetical protein
VRDLTEQDLTPWLRARLRQFFLSRAQCPGQSVFAHKFAGWPRGRFLREAFPEAKFVHIVRDGRAVANSFLQMPWWGGNEGPGSWRFGPLTEAYQEQWEQSGRSFVTLAGLCWNLLIDAYVAAEARIGADYWLTVRYEDILENPRHEFSRILDHLGLAWSDGFGQAFDRYEFKTKRQASYLADLSHGQRLELTDVCWRHLQRFGYEPTRLAPLGDDRSPE